MFLGSVRTNLPHIEPRLYPIVELVLLIAQVAGDFFIDDLVAMHGTKADDVLPKPAIHLIERFVDPLHFVPGRHPLLADISVEQPQIHRKLDDLKALVPSRVQKIPDIAEDLMGVVGMMLEGDV